MFRHFVKDYLTFSKKDRIGALCIIIIVGGATSISFFSPKAPPLDIRATNLPLSTANTTASDLPSQTDESLYPGEVVPPLQRSTAALFRFDPNTATTEELQRLGLSARTAKTIENYRNKGGRFYQPEDLKKIWGLKPEFYERVKDFIVINKIEQSRPKADYKPFVKVEKTISIVDVNSADTTALITLPGIGSRLSARIINFRDKLGGFVSVDQVGETYGVPDSTFQKIKAFLKIDPARVRKMNLNTATKEELQAHPYIRWNIANAIINYRNQHGNYKSVEELQNIHLIDNDLFEKIAPYLAVQ